MPKALVNIKHNFAITTVVNAGENPVKITFNEPISIKEIHFHDHHDIESNYEYNFDLNREQDKLLKAN